MNESFENITNQYELTVLLPTLNEQDSLDQILTEIKLTLNKTKINYCILVTDNGSIDKTLEICKMHNVILNNVIDEYEERFEYDKKNRLVRWSCIYSTKENSWKTFSYSKDKMTILHRRIGNPPVIHKMVFGPEENGMRDMISEKFL
jgi:hypothetical protein